MVTFADVFWLLFIVTWFVFTCFFCYSVWRLRQEQEAALLALSLLGREVEAHQKWTGLLSTRLTHLDRLQAYFHTTSPQRTPPASWTPSLAASTPSLFRVGGTLYSMPDPRDRRSNPLSPSSSPPTSPQLALSRFRLGSMVSDLSLIHI